MAALKDSIEVAQLLLDNGAMVEMADRNGRTALHLAAKSDSIRVSKALVEFGASIDSTDKGGRFPLHIATGTAFMTCLWPSCTYIKENYCYLLDRH